MGLITNLSELQSNNNFTHIDVFGMAYVSILYRYEKRYMEFNFRNLAKYGNIHRTRH